MTRDHQVEAARKLREKIDAALATLDPPPPQDERDEYRHDIAFAVDSVVSRTEAAVAHKVFLSKKGMIQLRRYRDALRASRQLQASYGALDPAIRPWFSLAETVHVAGTETIIDRVVPIIDRELKKVEQFLDRKSPEPRRNAIRKKVAVAVARDLLGWWGRKVVAARGSEWDELARVLAEAKTTLYGHLCAFKSTAPSVKKFQTAEGSLRVLAPPDDAVWEIIARLNPIGQ
jgi:hypothetical protein